VSRINFIGPTTNLQLLMPFEATWERYFHLDTDTALAEETIDSLQLYRDLLPSGWRDYTPMMEAWSAGHIAVSDLWSLYAQYPYMPRLRSREVLIDSIDNQPLLWQSEGLAVADSYDEAADRYSGLWLPGETGRSSITDATLIVKPELAERQRAADVPPSATPTPGTPDDDDAPRPAGTGPTPPVTKPTATRYVGSVPINAERYSADFAKIAAEVLANLAASGAKLSISLSVDAVHTDGFTEQQLRTIRENAATLKFTTNEFEAG